MCVVRSPRMENLCRLISLILLIKKINHVQSKSGRLSPVFFLQIPCMTPRVQSLIGDGKKLRNAFDGETLSLRFSILMAGIGEPAAIHVSVVKVRRLPAASRRSSSRAHVRCLVASELWGNPLSQSKETPPAADPCVSLIFLPDLSPAREPDTAAYAFRKVESRSRHWTNYIVVIFLSFTGRPPLCNPVTICNVNVLRSLMNTMSDTPPWDKKKNKSGTILVLYRGKRKPAKCALGEVNCW